MAETLSTAKIKAARKPHRCSCCTCVAVQIGEPYTRTSLLHDDRVYTWVTCAECDAIFDLVDDWAGGIYNEDGVGPDEYVGWARDFSDDPTDGEAARAFLTRRQLAITGADHG